MSNTSDTKVIISVKGGLGNQMFQYVFYKYLLGKGVNAWLDIDRVLYQNIPPPKLKLDYFNLDKRSASFVEYRDLIDLAATYRVSILIKKRLWLPIMIKIIRKILKTVVFIKNSYQVETRKHNAEYFIKHINNERNLYIDGFFQSWKHINEIRETVLNDFAFIKGLSPQIVEMANKIERTNSVSIHVRRGDYLKYKKYNICSTYYYRAAVEFINSKQTDLSYFIFSDDIDYIKSNFTFLKNYYIVNTSKETISEYYDLFLMSRTKHNIIANSTFSWWGAYLNQNPNKLVLVPSKWQFDDDNQSMINTICPPEWIRIPLVK